MANSIISNALMQTPTEEKSITSNGLTLSYRTYGKICAFQIIGIPTDTTTSTSFSNMPKSAEGMYNVCGQWGDVSNQIAFWIDKGTTTLYMRYYNFNYVRASGVYLIA